MKKNLVKLSAIIALMLLTTATYAQEFHIGAKAGAKAIKATAKKVGQKAWDGYIKQVEKRAGVKVAFLHYQSIFKFCDYITGFGGTITDAISKGLQNKLGFNKTLAYYIAKAFVLIVL